MDNSCSGSFKINWSLKSGLSDPDSSLFYFTTPRVQLNSLESQKEIQESQKILCSWGGSDLVTWKQSFQDLLKSI